MSSPHSTAHSDPIEEGSSLWKDAWLRLKKNRLAMLSAWVIIAILLLTFIYPLIANFFDALALSPNEQNLKNKFAPPSRDHWLGTDSHGRDLFSRIIVGGQISLLVALLSTVLTVTFGVIYGGVAGYIGGRVQSFMMRIVDGLLAMPFLIIVILFRELIKSRLDLVSDFLVDSWGWDADFVLRFSNIVPLVFAIGAFGWLTMGRIVCTQAASLVRLEFVEAARSLGLGHIRILFRHIIPNMLGPIIIYATLTIPSFILYESTLSFIGLGIEPPNPSWGNLIKEGANHLETHLSVLLWPALIFAVTLFSFNFLGDGLRDALDPKSSKD